MIQNEPIATGVRFRWSPSPIPDLSSDWATALSDLAVECLDALPGRQGVLLKDAHSLLSAAGDQLLSSPVSSEECFQRLLDCKAYESAGIQLLGLDVGYVISRSPDGAHIVTVSMPTQDEVTFECTSPALGLVAGLATALARLDKNRAPGRHQEHRVN